MNKNIIDFTSIEETTAIEKDYYSYVYRITHIKSKMHYYGSRFCKMENRYSHIALEDLKQYQSSSTNNLWKQNINEFPEEFKFKIIKVFKNVNRNIGELEALHYEGILHNKFDVGKHKKFINKHNQEVINIEKYVNNVFELIDFEGRTVRFMWKHIDLVCKFYGIDNIELLKDIIYHKSSRQSIYNTIFKTYEYYYKIKESNLLKSSILPKANKNNKLCRIYDINKNIIEFYWDNRSNILDTYKINNAALWSLVVGKVNQVNYSLYKDKNTINYYNKINYFMDIDGNYIGFNRRNIPTIAKLYGCTTSQINNLFTGYAKSVKNVLFIKNLWFIPFYLYTDKGYVQINLRYKLENKLSIRDLKRITSGSDNHIKWKYYRDKATYDYYNTKHTLYRIESGILVEYNLTKKEIIETIDYPGLITNLFTNSNKQSYGFSLYKEYATEYIHVLK